MPLRLPELEDDGLITPEVGDWGEAKYRLVRLYAELFTKATKGKWDRRVYIDLFSGSGHARIKSTSKIVPTSPLLVLGNADKFDRYIFCELDPEKLSALEVRVKRSYPGVDAHFIPGDTNKNLGEITSRIPQHRQGFKVLSFCFVDPYGIDNLSFETVRRLSERFVDFMVLIPSGMDANRNVAKYSKEENSKISKFLGVPDWRTEWTKSEDKHNFEWFVRDQFGKQMAALKYIYEGSEDMKAVRLGVQNVLLYHLAFFSRSDLGKKLWKQACKYTDDQLALF